MGACADFIVGARLDIGAISSRQHETAGPSQMRARKDVEIDRRPDTPNQKQCTECGRVFEPKRSFQMTCGSVCGEKRHKRLQKACRKKEKAELAAYRGKPGG